MSTNRFWTNCLLASLSLMIASSMSSAQSEPAKPAGTAITSQLYLVSRVGADVNLDDLKRKFVNGISNTADVKCNKDGIKVTPIDADRYRFLVSMVRQGPSNDPLEGDISFSPDEGPGNQWSFFLGSKYFDLKKIVITFSGKNGEEKRTFEDKEIGGVGDTGTVIASRRPGWYFVQLPEGLIAKKYEATVVDIQKLRKKEPAESTFSGEWPARSRYCLIEIPDFRGDEKGRDQLRKTLLNESKIGEPIVLDQANDSVILWLAEIGDVEGITEVGVFQNVVTMTLPKPTNRSPKRVWMMFPLTEEEAKTTVDGFLESKGSGIWKSGVTISNEIQRSKPVKAPLQDVVPKYTIRSADKPQWFELPRIQKENQTSFQAHWECQGVSDWKALKEARDWRVYVFEFEDPKSKESEAVSVIHPMKKIRVRAVDESLGHWNLRLSPPTAPASEK